MSSQHQLKIIARDSFCFFFCAVCSSFVSRWLLFTPCVRLLHVVQAESFGNREEKKKDLQSYCEFFNLFREAYRCFLFRFSSACLQYNISTVHPSSTMRTHIWNIDISSFFCWFTHSTTLHLWFCCRSLLRAEPTLRLRLSFFSRRW